MKKLIFPIIAIVATTVVSVGATYALFTSNDTTNIAVTSGKVKLSAAISNLKLYSPTLISPIGEVIDDTNAVPAGSTIFYNGGTASINGNTLDLSHVSPGDKINFNIDFDNKSNIDIKYCVVYEDVTSYDGTETAKLIDVLVVKNGDKSLVTGDKPVSWTKVSANASIDSLDISVELPSATSNTYANLDGSLKFSVFAVQGNAYTDDDCKVSISYTDNFSVDNTEFSFSKNKEILFEVTEYTEDTSLTIELKYNNNTYSTINFSTSTSVLFPVEVKIDDDTIMKCGTKSQTGNEFDTKVGDTSKYKITEDTTINFYAYCCVLEGTPITMSDYSFKNVEDLVAGDKILAYDFFAGKFVSSEVNYTFDEYGFTDTFKVNLDNNTSVTIANNEDMFDVNTKEFFTIGLYSYQSIVGREVLINNKGENSKAKIISVDHKHEHAHYYTVYSIGYVNYVANNILMQYSENGFNYMYSVTDDLKIDMDAYNADVEKYGLYTYSDFPMLTKEMFDEFDIGPSKFVVEKGYISQEEMIELMWKFSREYSTYKPLFLEKK